VPKNVSENSGFFYQFTKDANFTPAEVSKNDRLMELPGYKIPFNHLEP
jgi:hypothetical protein